MFKVGDLVKLIEDDWIEPLKGLIMLVIKIDEITGSVYCWVDDSKQPNPWNETIDWASPFYEEDLMQVQYNGYYDGLPSR